MITALPDKYSLIKNCALRWNVVLMDTSTLRDTLLLQEGVLLIRFRLGRF